MIIYRPHRGNLLDAMEEAKEFQNELEMKEYIAKSWNEFGFGTLFSIDDIVIDNETINDERIGWKDTRYVCVNRIGKDNYLELYGVPQCIGMCATDYKYKN